MEELDMRFAVRLLTTVLGLGAASAAIPESLTVNDRVFTKDQAENGEALYEVNCIACHDKKYFRPVLKAWEGQPLGVLFNVMSASMPQSNPGALPDKDYVDILAYILSQSRYPAGDSELSVENGALDNITIAARD
ncbi:MAG: cytochrome c [Gammaproteobacteria bacterium]|nr:cytochrome c [Gammaproteobacteria bacterium]MDH4254537.1 cytochrome c [Gammaproteobacteria bacterium]